MVGHPETPWMGGLVSRLAIWGIPSQLRKIGGWVKKWFSSNSWDLQNYWFECWEHFPRLICITTRKYLEEKKFDLSPVGNFSPGVFEYQRRLIDCRIGEGCMESLFRATRSKYFLYSQVIAPGFIVIMNEASVAGIEPATSESCLMSPPLRPNLGDQIAYYCNFFRYLDLRNTNAKSSQPTTNVLTEFCPDLCTTYHF